MAIVRFQIPISGTEGVNMVDILFQPTKEALRPTQSFFSGPSALSIFPYTDYLFKTELNYSGTSSAGGGINYVGAFSYSATWFSLTSSPSVFGPDVLAVDSITAVLGVSVMTMTQLTARSLELASQLVGNDNILGTERSDYLVGFSGEDSISGRGGNDTLYGGVGNDTLSGDIGNDVLNGGAGADVFYGGSGDDRVTYATANAGLLVNLAASGNNTGDAAGDTYSGIQSLNGSDFGDRLRGSTLQNTLWGGLGGDDLAGGGGLDSLYGGDGNDTLYGQSGSDTLFGGNGADEFRFATGSEEERIGDFTDNIDRIVFSGISGIVTAAQALSRAVEINGNVKFDFGGGDILWVVGSTKAALLDDVSVI
jgi:Ca2+-binding RTX toxin-like protein